MPKVLLFLTSLIATTSLCLAQTPHHEYLAKLNYMNASHFHNDSIKGVTWVTETAAYDANHHRYFFQGNFSGSAPWTLYTIDAHTGAVIYNPKIPSNQKPTTSVFGLQYDNAADTLYGIYRDSTNALNFAWIEATNGAVHVKRLIDSAYGYLGSSATYDKNHHYYIFQGSGTGPTHLFVLDAHTGAIVYKPNFSKSYGINFLQYSYTRNCLYGTAYIPGGQGSLEFDSIELKTGIQHKIAPLPLMSSSQTGTGVINENAGQFIFEGISQTSSDTSTLYTLDLQTGAIVNQVFFPYFRASVTSGENLIYFNYDNLTDTLYALNWAGEVACTAATAGVITTPRDTVCVGAPVKLTLTGSTGSIQWLTDTSYKYTLIPGASATSYSTIYSSPKTVYYKVIAGTGICADTSDYMRVIIVASPVAHFTYTSTDSLTFHFSSTGSSGATSYSWSFGDESPLDTGVSAVHTFDTSGVLSVCLTTYNNANCSYSYCQNIHAEHLTGVQKVNGASEFTIYPNPGNGRFTLYFNYANQTGNPVPVDVINILGQTIQTVTATASQLAKGQNIQLPENTPVGNYFVKITAGASVYVSKLTVIK